MSGVLLAFLGLPELTSPHKGRIFTRPERSNLDANEGGVRPNHSECAATQKKSHAEMGFIFARRIGLVSTQTQLCNLPFLDLPESRRGGGTVARPFVKWLLKY